uniref:ABC transmembrane type-1 domain-containing protein n=1 Tax=Timema cristinae TaxID=61476 RepID=A0A7R9GQP2_TIMCR|nr:unnamed protein product [Timema cristinae]
MHAQLFISATEDDQLAICDSYFKELFRVAGNYIIGHKHVGVGNPQAHNDQLATFPSLADTPTLRVEAPRTRQTQKATSLWPGDPPNRDPYVPAYKLFFPKVPAEAPGKKQFFRTVVPSRVLELETCDPYVPAYKLFFPKVPAEAPGKKHFFRMVVPSRVFELGTCNPYVPEYTLFFKNRYATDHRERVFMTDSARPGGSSTPRGRKYDVPALDGCRCQWTVLDRTRALLSHVPRPLLPLSFLFSLYVFMWMKEFLWTGYKRDLEQSDLYEPLKIDLSENLGDDLERVWEEEQSRALQKGKSPSLLRAIFVTFWKQYIFSGILTFLVSMGSRVAQPLLLGKVIEYFTPNSTMAIEEAYMYGAGMIVNVYLMVIMDHHYNLSAAAVGMRIRIACCSLIYRKVLKLSMVSSGKTTTGWLVNLLSNDVNRFDMVTLFLHFIWIAPLQVLLVTYFLWQYVGVAAFIGVAFIFLQTIPVQSEQPTNTRH